MKLQFDSDTFPKAIKHLFELNHYEVTGPIQIHGAEIDLVAEPQFDPFASPIYIEATIEYVDNEKYGKDVGKLAMIGELKPNAQRLIVSAKGFSLPVRERAQQTRILTLTYDELFSKFEKFEPYINQLGDAATLGQELLKLNMVYEEPYFDDTLGKDQATQYLTTWRDQPKPDNRWLIIIGEYGTGKTALTKVLQYRWLSEYIKDPSKPIPFRMELRDFTKQFDASGLLHHFLDHNKLGHIPIDFVFSLIRSGRVVLLLDGYDEMAQYLHARERRICLEALAQLSAEGARGILTSRPNYFTEAEELQVFEILYSSLDYGKYYLSSADQDLVRREAEVDQLLKIFLDRYERNLKDLTPEQTEALVNRVLEHDSKGREVVLNVLHRIFRGVEVGAELSLSGKPVIISYLLEVVEGLKEQVGKEPKSLPSITEWGIYKLIVDQLMLRDYRRSSFILPGARRRFLQKMAVMLSHKDKPYIDQVSFYDLIHQSFGQQIRRLPQESRQQETERYFADLRTSATLTRAEILSGAAWKYSHNSLREFLATEQLIHNLESGVIVEDHVPISDPMRLFVRSKEQKEIANLVLALKKHWADRSNSRGFGQLLTLLFDAAVRLHASSNDPIRDAIANITGSTISLSGIEIARLTFSTEQKPTDLSGAVFSDSSIYDCSFIGAKLQSCNFSHCIIENINFATADLSDTTFDRSTLIDVIFTAANLKDSSFKNVEHSDISILIEDQAAKGGLKRLIGEQALGYLEYHGAKTNIKSRTAVLRNHPKFFIVGKILEKLAEQALRQRRGLQQRGAAQQDVRFARDFVAFLESKDVIYAPKNRKDLVEVTQNGRAMLTQYEATKELPDFICDFLQEH